MDKVWRTSLTRLFLAALVAMAIAMFWIVGSNPGYFSHDELQWGERALHTSHWWEQKWVSWFGYRGFQFRPLTFNLWLIVSSLFYGIPSGFHLFYAMLGVAISALLYRTLKRASVSRSTALFAALAFWLSPYAAWVHSWVGTLGDVLWVGCALLLADRLLAGERLSEKPFACAAMAALFCGIALLAKESGLAIPCLLFVAMLASKDRRWRYAFFGAAAVGTLYLALRLPVLLDPARSQTSYGVDWAGSVGRFAGYLLFPFNLGQRGANSITVVSWQYWALWGSLVVSILLGLCVSFRKTALFLLALLAALGPSLLINSMASQYAYGMSAVFCAGCAICWARGAWLGRTTALAALAVISLHGIQVAWIMRGIGELQATFSPSLVRALETVPERKVVGLFAVCSNQRPYYYAFTANVPEYYGTALQNRVTLVDNEASAELTVDCTGQVTDLSN